MSKSIHSFARVSMRAAFVFLATLTGQHTFGTHSANAETGVWEDIAPGYQLLRFELGPPSLILQSEVFVLRFDPSLFELDIIHSEEIGKKRGDVPSMTQALGGIVGINAHFFGKEDEVLGLYHRALKNEKKTFASKLQLGGNLLTGVLQVRSGKVEIVHRSDYNLQEDISIAIQAGPRLIAKGKKLELKPVKKRTRRSGVAVDAEGRFLIYATLLRFPGASLQEIQDMLLSPSIGAIDALNLDGGSSSQLYIRANKAISGDTFISGGDMVPTALIVRPRNSMHSDS